MVLSRRQWKDLYPFYTTLFLTTLAHTLITGQMRYRLPLMPILILFSSYALFSRERSSISSLAWAVGERRIISFQLLSRSPKTYAAPGFLFRPRRRQRRAHPRAEGIPVQKVGAGIDFSTTC